MAARKALAELSAGSAGLEVTVEVERAHDAVEAAERRLAAAKLPALAVRARQQLRKAREAEQQVLVRHGYGSWLALQMRRLDVLLAPPSPEAVAAAEVEYRQALAALEELAGRRRTDRDRVPLASAPWLTGWSASPT